MLVKSRPSLDCNTPNDSHQQHSESSAQSDSSLLGMFVIQSYMAAFLLRYDGCCPKELGKDEKCITNKRPHCLELFLLFE